MVTNTFLFIFMNMKLNILIILLCATLSSCFNGVPDDIYRHVEPLMEEHVNSFVAEGRARGVDINTDDLKISFKKLDGLAGIAYHSQNEIFIDSTTVHWKKNREEVIFHELAHIYLYREHDDNLLAPKMYKSLMTVHGTIKYARNPERRKYYLDELFNPNTPTPEWAK